MSMLSPDEINAVYGKQGGAQPEQGGAGESDSLVDMPSGSSALELNPQSLEFEDINVGRSAAAAPPPSTTTSTVPGLPSAQEAAASKAFTAVPIGGPGPSGSLASLSGSSLQPSFQPQHDGSAASASIFQLAYYKPLFDVDTAQILTRSVHAVIPRPRAQFFDVIGNHADMYGPFWIPTTLIFIIGVTGNLAKWMSFKPDTDHPFWSYDFSKLTTASSVVYAYVFLAPLCVWAALRYIQANKPLVDVMCLYGYGMIAFVPVALLCVLPSGLLRWVLLALGGASSGVFIVTNFLAHLQDVFPYSDSDSMRRGYALLAAVGSCHALFTLLLKIAFFSGS